MQVGTELSSSLTRSRASHQHLCIMCRVQAYHHTRATAREERIDGHRMVAGFAGQEVAALPFFGCDLGRSLYRHLGLAR
jgi:hypothetical protein